jgi:hypothetical protein
MRYRSRSRVRGEISCHAAGTRNRKIPSQNRWKWALWPASARLAIE